jgi:hypothetical protein
MIKALIKSVIFCFDKGNRALSFDFPQVLQVCFICVAKIFEHFESFTGSKIIALPAANVTFLFSAFSYSALCGAAAGPTAFLTAHFHHRPEKLTELLVVFEGVKGRDFGEGRCGFIAFAAAKLFLQVPCKIGDALRISGATAAI